MKQGILRVHPDLAGRLAEQNALTSDSKSEQQSSGLLTLSQEEKTFLRAHNLAYKTKFLFPFVICARQNKKEAILREIVKRYDRTVEEETESALKEVMKIALFRLKNKLEMTEPEFEQILSRLWTVYL